MCFIFGEDLHGTLALSNPVGFFVNKICLKQNNLALAIEAKIINPKKTNMHNDIFMQ